MSDPIESVAEALDTLAIAIGEIQTTQVSILGHMADAAQAAEEAARHQAQTNDLLRGVSNELMHLRADLNRYIDSAPKQASDIRRRIAALEEKAG